MCGYLSVVLSVACPFAQYDQPKVRPVGPAVEADILIYFNKGASDDDINAFSKNVLSTPHPEGRGDYLAPGVRTLLKIREVEEHEGIALTFFPNASNEHRQGLLKSIKASSLVYRVLENTSPNSVKTLE
jgi:hypothetical protein